jgi:hypothetical protein
VAQKSVPHYSYPSLASRTFGLNWKCASAVIACPCFHWAPSRDTPRLQWASHETICLSANFWCMRYLLVLFIGSGFAVSSPLASAIRHVGRVAFQKPGPPVPVRATR